MTDTTTSFYDVASFDGRVFPFGDYRRILRAIGERAVIGLGAVAAVGVTAAVATLAAAWLVGIALSNNPTIRAAAPVGSRTIVAGNQYPVLASSVDFSHSARILTGPASDADLAPDPKWARAAATTSTPIAIVPLPPKRPVETANNVPSRPQPLSPGAVKPTEKMPDVRGLAHVAALSPPALPTAALTSAPPPSKPVAERADSAPLPRARPLDAPRIQPKKDIAPARVAAAAPQAEAVKAPPPPAASVNPASPQQAPNSSTLPPSPDSRTAIYDIKAHTVYLPNGERLEAHSGLGSRMDDPRYVNVRMRGPTPPNVYDLTLREEIFHGVRAIRLNPVDDDKMFGRDGMLAHTYMLGPNGQSNGCVSFRDYAKFLHAYLRGEVDRLVVVAHLDKPPSSVVRAHRRHGDRYAFND